MFLKCMQTYYGNCWSHYLFCYLGSRSAKIFFDIRLFVTFILIDREKAVKLKMAASHLFS